MRHTAVPVPDEMTGKPALLSPVRSLSLDQECGNSTECLYFFFSAVPHLCYALPSFPEQGQAGVLNRQLSFPYTKQWRSFIMPASKESKSPIANHLLAAL